MLIAARDLVRRLRAPAPRKAEVARLRARLAQTARERASAEEIVLASQMRALRPALADAFAGVSSCRGCARGRPLPHGRWRGGFCCGGETDGVFDDDEVAALAIGGTASRQLRSPDGELSGCAFRGPTGCSLEPVDRPNVCVRFACRELEAELRARGDWAAVRALSRQLEAAFARFVRARSERRRLEE